MYGAQPKPNLEVMAKVLVNGVTGCAVKGDGPGSKITVRELG
jgi:hypothetical protein